MLTPLTRMRPFRLLWWLVPVLGCAASGGAESGPVDAGTHMPVTPACLEGAPQSCSCGAVLGTQRCSGGTLLDCECDAGAPPAAPPARPQGGEKRLCKAGRYAGGFEGLAGFLVAFTPVVGIDPEGIPALLIELDEAERGSEFFLVGNGKMQGNANATFPFEASITGNLNCSTLRFTGELVGGVALGAEDIINQFTGSLTARYDPEAHALVEGEWSVVGSATDGGLDLGLTGMGSWNAEHQGALDAGP